MNLRRSRPVEGGLLSRSAMAHALREIRGRFGDRGLDTRIGPAATQITAHCGLDVFRRGPDVFREKRNRRHDLTRLAVAALRHAVAGPGALDRPGHRAGDALDGRHLASSGRADREGARSNRLAVDMDRTGAT